ncbi:aminotransferase class V-fold PLP-dependent enzyme [Roseburia sp. MUC/MUC-530-WT-4D]|uniref:cysteine desulfurase n=1 Tax=Roseburia porci TaxID=2605790 RepID=A0A6L5YS24_9FIRM|nr:aminotransferase class V-fold PLP-dependent enzyme [Roseburia porci]MCI5517045.1 aminotransferase class V-fold PLP-dependent enzyme [Roseburia sp.]MDD6742062.1 aminotransferase class V-fold PLP-dependent enzyme [Roseburia porci]MST75118.1 aminotransferase class V-fold PLP-dependent enzyme [Roseburia porci]
MIYFDNAATSLHKPETVIKAVTEAMTSLGNASRGAHSAALGSNRMVYETRELLAELFHIDDPSRIAFTMNATESLNIAIAGIFRPEDHVITTVLEHNSVLRPLYRMEESGTEVSFLQADKKGNISYEELENAIRPNTRAVICTHASNLTGNVLDLEKIGEICEKHRLLFLVDASQTAGIIPIDVRKMKISVLCFTGHKGLLGPQGTGGIYVAPEINIRPLIVGGSGVQSYLKTQPDEMPARLEAGTLNAHGIAGLHAALSYIIEKGVEQIYQEEHEKTDYFYRMIRNIPDIHIYGDPEAELHAPIIALNIGDYDSAQVADELMEAYGIAIRAGAHCAPLMHQALGTQKQGAVRFSFSQFNTREELDAGIQALRELADENP